MDRYIDKCPFCGGSPETIVEMDIHSTEKLMMSAYVKCTKCGVYQRIKFMARTFNDFDDAFNKAIDVWNLRVRD